MAKRKAKAAIRLFQVTRRDLVYVDQLYEVRAASADDAKALVLSDQGEWVDAQMQETYSVGGIKDVNDCGPADDA